MVTLLRLRSAFPHYDAALRAPDPITYVREVSRSWATDPNRAEKVIAIYRQYIAGSQNEELPDESKNAV
jgi:flagellum-specific peptidoglycan hydrolase FlgJ